MGWRCPRRVERGRGWQNHLVRQCMAAIGRQATCSRAISNIKLHGVVFGIDDGGALERRPWKQRGRGRVEVDDLGRRGAKPRRVARFSVCNCAWSGRGRHGASLRGCRRTGSSCGRVGQHCWDCSAHVAPLAVGLGPVAVAWVSCGQVRACAVVGRAVAAVGRARCLNVAHGHRAACAQVNFSTRPN